MNEELANLTFKASQNQQLTLVSSIDSINNTTYNTYWASVSKPHTYKSVQFEIFHIILLSVVRRSVCFWLYMYVYKGYILTVM